MPARAEHDVRRALQPPHLRTNRGSVRGQSSARLQGVVDDELRDGRPDLVRSCVATAAGHHSQGTGAAHALPCLHEGEPMRAIEEETVRAALESGVRNQIRAAVVANFKIVHQRLACVLQEKLQPVRRAVGDDSAVLIRLAVEQKVGDINGRPWGFRGFVAVGPIRGQPIVGPRINQFQRTAAAITPLAPTSAVPIGHFVDRGVNMICR